MHAEFTGLSLVPIQPRTASSLQLTSPGPGWFESSWDLRCGLDVRELDPADAAPAQRSLRVVALRTSERTASPRSITARA